MSVTEHMDRLNTQPQASGSLFSPTVIAVSSGKGGVGKTNISANLALSLGKLGAKVLCVDADLGLANMDIVLGVTPMYTTADLFNGEATIQDILIKGPHNVSLLPGASGQYDLANLSERRRMQLFAAIDSLDECFDFVIVDTGAGIGSNATSFASAAQDIFLVVTPEPTSIADAYGMLKVLSLRCKVQSVQILVNQAKSAMEAERVFDRLVNLCTRFLTLNIDLVGHIPYDPMVSRSVMRGEPFVLSSPQSPASQAMKALAQRVSSKPSDGNHASPISFFWQKLLHQGAAA